MEFLDDLKTYLNSLQWRRRGLDVAAHRRHFLRRLDEHKSAGMSVQAVKHLHRDTSPYLDDFIERVSDALARRLGEESGSGLSLTALVNVAIDRWLDIESTTGSIGLDLETQDIVQHTASLVRSTSALADEVRSISRYAVEIGAVTRGREPPSITEIGKLVLTLPPRDALRWLLAVEVTQSLGPEDEWRLCRFSIRTILGSTEWEHPMEDDEDELAPASWPALRRLCKMGLVSFEDTGDGTELFHIEEQGHLLLEELAADKDTPFTLLARALLQDQTAATLAGLPGAAALVQREGAATVATRHARMVAHEIRNALVPVQAALSGLYKEVERRGQVDALIKRRDQIDGGIDRIFRFVREVAQTADLTTKSAELFNIALAIESAIAGIEAELGLSIPFTREAELHPVKGSSDRFVLAIRNLLRNAAQSRTEPPVRIHITGGVNNGAEVFVRVDDDGPGVPLDDRSKIFEPGFTGRPGGSGQGLVFVREVVESEMAGRVLCEESPLGGARFVVRLPVGTKRSA